MKRDRPIPTRDSLPAGWTVERWDRTKAALRDVIWARAVIDDPIGYEELSKELKLSGVIVGHRSSPMTGLLNELAADVHEDAKCWVTTFVVWAGTKRSSDGLFRLVPKVEWEHLGPTAFCRQQRQLAHIWITKHPET